MKDPGATTYASNPHVNQPDTIDVALEPLKHNDRFYFKNDPMAVFLVENQLFRVHRYYFEAESEVFCNMFSLPSPKGEGSEDPEGTCDEQPISLPSVTVREFETLLEFFYSLHREPNANGLDSQKRREMFLNLQSISHRFVFDDIFKYATQQLLPSEVPVAQRIHLGDKYGLQDWLFSAYKTLLDRTEPLTVEEVDALGAERIARFLRAKEDMYQERLSIAREDTKHQLNRAFYAEQYLESLVGHYYHGGYANDKAPSRTPTSTDQMVKKHFLETSEITRGSN